MTAIRATKHVAEINERAKKAIKFKNVTVLHQLVVLKHSHHSAKVFFTLEQRAVSGSSERKIFLEIAPKKITILHNKHLVCAPDIASQTHCSDGRREKTFLLIFFLTVNYANFFAMMVFIAYRDDREARGGT